MDIAKYFQNIDKSILYNILQRKIKDKKLLWLTKEILYSNGVKKGLPIGNYTSQCFANIYLNELDQYQKTIRDLTILKNNCTKEDIQHWENLIWYYTALQKGEIEY